jgi:hypothetical protein
MEAYLVTLRNTEVSTLLMLLLPYYLLLPPILPLLDSLRP